MLDGGRPSEVYTEMSFVEPYAAKIFICALGQRKKNVEKVVFILFK